MRRALFEPHITLDTSSAVPLHHQLSVGIMRELRQCRVSAGTAIMPILNLAKAYHLNRETVRKAYAVLEEEHVLCRTPGGRILEVTEAFADANASRRLCSIGLVLPNRLCTLLHASASTALQTVVGMMDAASDQEISAMVVPLPSNSSGVERFRGWLEDMLSRLDGLIYLGEDEGFSHERAFDILLSKHQLPQVFVSGHRFQPHLGIVEIDMAIGFRKALDLLWGLGHRRFAVCSNVIPMRRYFQLQTYDRSDVLLSCLRDYEGCATVPLFKESSGDFLNDLSFRELLRSPSRPTALLCTEDSRAQMVLDIVHEEGLRVPEDISVIGYGDTAALSMLTSIHHPWMESGRAAVQMIAESWRRGVPVHELKKVLPTSLTVRNSSGPAPVL